MTELNRRMSALDASFLYLERPNALLHVAGVYTVAEAVDYEDLVRDVERRLPLIPRYVQRAAMVPYNLGHPTWEFDPDFNIRNHVRRHQLARPQDDKALAQLCAKLFAEPLDRARPLWEMHLIEGYQDKGCAILMKAHHAMIDGASGVALINILLDPNPKPVQIDRELVLPAPSALPSPFARALEGLSDSIRSQYDVLKRAGGLWGDLRKAVEETRATVEASTTLARTVLEGVTPMPFNGTLSEKRAIAWSRLSLNEIKTLKSRFGGTVNDVVLTIISGALGRYLQSRGVKTIGRELKAMVPVNVREAKEQGALGNRVSTIIAELPIGIPDPVSRLRHISASMELIKMSGMIGQVKRIVGLADLLPPVLQAPLSRLQGAVSPVHTICTNVPGPRERRYLLGKPVDLMVPLVPLGANIGLGFAILSYADQLTIGINADAEKVRDPGKIAEAIDAAFEELWSASGLERVRPVPRVETALQRRQRLHSEKEDPSVSS